MEIRNPMRLICFLLLSMAALAIMSCSKNDSSSQASLEQTPPKLSTWPNDVVNTGDTLLVNGENFQEDCGVKLYFDGATRTVLATATTTSKGDFQIQTAIPHNLSIGTHEISAQGLGGSDCSKPTTKVAFAKIVVGKTIPLIEIDTIEGRPGGTMTITGRGFCGDGACSPVTILADGNVVAKEVTVETDGSFSTAAPIPAVDNAGEILVVAIQTDADSNTLRGFGDIIVTVRPEGKRPEIF